MSIHFLPLLLSLGRQRSDVSKLTIGFLCLLEDELKLLVTWEKHSHLLLDMLLVLKVIFTKASAAICTLWLRKQQASR